MENNIFNFVKVEVEAADVESAFENVNFNCYKNATMKYKSMFPDGCSEKELKAFCIDYLKNQTKNAAGLGCYIVLESSVKDTRERPYSVVESESVKGKRKYSHFYQLVDKKTGSVMLEVEGTKAKALELAKKLYTESGYKDNLLCKHIKLVTEGEPVAFEINYTPSKGTKNGKYIVFGIEG